MLEKHYQGESNASEMTAMFVRDRRFAFKANAKLTSTGREVPGWTSSQSGHR